MPADPRAAAPGRPPRRELPPRRVLPGRELPSRRELLTLALGAGATAGLAGVLAACSGPDAAGSGGSTGATDTPGGSGSASPTTAPGIDPRRFGAVGDGAADDTAALQRAFDALGRGQTLTLGEGRTYRHTEVLHVRNPGVVLAGPGTLLAADEQYSAVQIEAEGVTVEGVTFAVESTTKRWSTPDQHKLFVGDVDGVTLREVVVTGSAAAGIFLLGATNFRLDRVQVSDTRADGVHMTWGSSNGVVDHPTVRGSGDDGVAVVSYQQDGRDCHDIEITAPTVEGTTWGRGISVVGGHDITYTDVTVSKSSAAAVYIACEGDPSNTSDTTRVSVRGGMLSGSNTNADIDHGAVLVYSGRDGGSVTDVQISDLTVTGTRAGASRQIGVVANSDADGVDGVRFSGLTLAGSPAPYQGNAPLAAVSLDAVKASGRTVQASRD